MSAARSIGRETLQAEAAKLFTLLPTLATIAAAAIALALLLEMAGQEDRGRGAEPISRAAVAPANSASEEFVWYVVDSPAKAKVLREALVASHGTSAFPGYVFVVRNAEEDALLISAVREAGPFRSALGLPEARVVDLRNQ